MKSIPNALIININQNQTVQSKKYFILSIIKRNCAPAFFKDRPVLAETFYTIETQAHLKGFSEVRKQTYLQEVKKRYLLVVISLEKNIRVDQAFQKSIIWRKGILARKGRKYLPSRDNWKVIKLNYTLCKVNSLLKPIVLLNLKRI